MIKATCVKCKQDFPIDELYGHMDFPECRKCFEPYKLTPEPDKNKDVHTEHCCGEHKRCKYGEEETTCSVVLRQKQPSFPCNCDWM